LDRELLDRARDDFLLFCQLVGVKLFDWQAEFAQADAKHRIGLCGRRAGKSYLAGALSVWWCFRRRDVQVLVVGGTEDGAKRTLEQAAFLCREHPWLGVAVEAELRESVTFGNGSRINAVPGKSEAAVRGWRRVDLVILDESQLIPTGTYRAVRPAISERPDSRILAFGTPGGGYGHWFRPLWERGLSVPDEYARSWNVPSTANPAVTEEELRSEAHMWGEAFVDQEYLAKWVDEAGLVWTRDQIYSCVVDVPPFTAEDAKKFSLGKTGMGSGAATGVSKRSWVRISAKRLTRMRGRSYRHWVTTGLTGTRPGSRTATMCTGCRIWRCGPAPRTGISWMR